MENLRQSIENQTTASLTLSKSVTQTHSPDSNLVFSPLSINVVLSLIAAGSSAQTLDQILSFLVSDSASSLHSLSSQLVSIVLSDGSPVGGPMISFANGVWVDRSLSVKEGFEKVVVGGYKAVLDSVDFQNKVVCGDYNAVLDSFDFQNKAVEVTNQVNLWAEKETNGLIKEVLPSGSVDGSTRLIFANALYFKGAWNEKFDSSKTKDYDFHLLDGSSVQVPFMTSKKKQLVSEFEGFKVLALPYKQGEDKRRFTMYFFLPDTKDGLPSLKDRIFSESDFLNRHLPYQAVEVGDFRIPRFKFGFGFEVSNTLKGLGLVLPFSGGGLTEMVNSPMGKDLYVSNVFHKSFIEVNEEGTEAVAVSAAVVNLRCLMVADKIDFVADHPFLFVIREDMTGVVLFVGQLLNPLKN